MKIHYHRESMCNKYRKQHVDYNNCDIRQALGSCLFWKRCYEFYINDRVLHIWELLINNHDSSGSICRGKQLKIL
jgi:hypothetical protein